MRRSYSDSCINYYRYPIEDDEDWSFWDYTWDNSYSPTDEDLRGEQSEDETPGDPYQ